VTRFVIFKLQKATFIELGEHGLIFSYRIETYFLVQKSYKYKCYTNCALIMDANKILSLFHVDIFCKLAVLWVHCNKKLYNKPKPK
jgi:hypothetical protein